MKLNKIIGAVTLVHSLFMVYALYAVFRIWDATKGVTKEGQIPDDVNILIGYGGMIGILGLIEFVSSIGLLLSKRWGFYLFYIAIVCLWLISWLREGGIMADLPVLVVGTIMAIMLIFNQSAQNIIKNKTL